ncbi:MAG: hypothetical protein M3X11_18960 [Acidobacteriota bacterium]|nr:hypothetical protein [Acidobacteriota bacterium]
MSNQNLSGNTESVLSSLPSSITDESSFREVLQFCIAEVATIHQGMEREQKEIDQLSIKIEEAMTRLRAT